MGTRWGSLKLGRVDEISIVGGHRTWQSVVLQHRGGRPHGIEQKGIYQQLLSLGWRLLFLLLLLLRGGALAGGLRHADEAVMWLSAGKRGASVVGSLRNRKLRDGKLLLEVLPLTSIKLEERPLFGVLRLALHVAVPRSATAHPVHVCKEKKDTDE
jgi:hypothetical protein